MIGRDYCITPLARSSYLSALLPISLLKRFYFGIRRKQALWLSTGRITRDFLFTSNVVT